MANILGKDYLSFWNAGIPNRLQIAQSTAYLIITYGNNVKRWFRLSTVNVRITLEGGAGYACIAHALAVNHTSNYEAMQVEVQAPCLVGSFSCFVFLLVVRNSLICKDFSSDKRYTIINSVS